MNLRTNKTEVYSLGNRNLVSKIQRKEKYQNSSSQAHLHIHQTQKNKMQRTTKTVTNMARPIKGPRPPNQTKSTMPNKQKRFNNPSKRPRITTNPTTAAYACCRVNPLESTMTVGIPDASAGKRITVDVREYYDVKVSSSGSLNAMMIPCTSSPLLFKDPTAASTGGTVTSSTGTSKSLTTSRPGNTRGSWIHVPINAFTNYINQDPTTAPITVSHPYYAVASRIVSQACKVMYTGKPMDASGVITVVGGDTSIDGQATSNVSGITRYNEAGVALSGYAAGTCECTISDFNFSAPPINSSVVKTVAEGIMVLNKRRTPVSTFNTTPNQPALLVEEDKTTSVLAGNTVGGDTIADLDSSFLTPTINLTSMTAGSTLRFEVVTCVEYLVDNRSTFAQLAKDAPYVSPSILQGIDRKIASLPIAAEPSFFNKAINFVLSSATTLAGAMAGPVVGATVSTITNAFRRSFLTGSKR